METTEVNLPLGIELPSDAVEMPRPGEWLMSEARGVLMLRVERAGSSADPLADEAARLAATTAAPDAARDALFRLHGARRVAVGGADALACAMEVRTPAEVTRGDAYRPAWCVLRAFGPNLARLTFAAAGRGAVGEVPQWLLTCAGSLHELR